MLPYLLTCFAIKLIEGMLSIQYMSMTMLKSNCIFDNKLSDIESSTVIFEHLIT